MPIDIPESIEIGGFTYSVEWGEGVSGDLQSKSVFSDTSWLLKRIRLDYKNTGQQTSNDWLHELIHAIDKVYLEGELEEAAVACLANGLQQVFKQLGVTFEIPGPKDVLGSEA